MTAKDVILTALGSTKFLMTNYFTDLSDADLLVRPVPGANHIAWQFGHLIISEIKLVKEQMPAAEFPKLPAGFEEAHAMDATKNDGPAGFLTKDAYLALFDKVRSATMGAAMGQPDSEFDRPTEGRMAAFAPKLGDTFILVANHTMMHGGQFSVVRRMLGKPILF